MWRCRRPCVVHRVTTLAVPSRCFEPSASPSLPTPSPTCSRGWWKSWANMEKKCRLVLCVCTWCVWACACRYENITHQYVQVFRDRPWGNFIFASFYSIYWFTLSFVFWWWVSHYHSIKTVTICSSNIFQIHLLLFLEILPTDKQAAWKTWTLSNFIRSFFVVFSCVLFSLAGLCDGSITHTGICGG